MITLKEDAFKVLDTVKTRILVDEEWDTSLQEIRENRIRFNAYSKEREAQKSAERKKKNHGEQ